MKKLGLTIMSAVCALCLSLCAIIGFDSVNYASAETGVTLSETKVMRSTQNDGVLLATAIKNMDAVFEIGYELTVSEGEVDIKTDAEIRNTRYYEAIQTGTKTWYAADIFGSEYEGAGIIAWEIAYNAEYTYHATAYAKEGTLVEGGIDAANAQTIKNATKTIALHTVSLQNEAGEELSSFEVMHGGSVSETAAEKSVAGYTYDWTLNGSAYDFAAAVTEDVVLVGTNKQLKAIGPDLLYMQINNGEPNTSGIEYEKTVSGKVSAVYQAVNPGGWSEVYEQIKIDSTTADVESWIADGYTHVAVDIYVNNYGNESDMNLQFDGTIITSVTNGQWNSVEIPLSILVSRKQFQVYYGAYAGNFEFAITIPRLIKNITVTLQSESGESLGTASLSGGKVDKSSLPAAPAGFEYAWQLNGTDFDFETVLTESITLTAVKKVKSIGFKTVYMQLDSGENKTSGISYNETVEGKTAMIKHTESVGWNEVYEQLIFNVTAEDIAAWKAAGYNYIEAEIYAFASQDGDNRQLKFYGTDTDLANGTWTTVKLSLDTLANHLVDSFQVWFKYARTGTFTFAMTTPNLVA